MSMKRSTGTQMRKGWAVEAITRDRMAHYGYTPEQIKAAEDWPGHEASGCFCENWHWVCENEDGKPNHPDRDELERTAEFVMWVLEHPALAAAHDPAATEPGAGTREALVARWEWVSTTALLAEFPMDSVGHIIACGYDDETLGGCECFTLPERLAAALAAVVARIEAEARETERERIAAAIEALFVKGWLVYNSGIADAARIARSRP